MDRLHSLPEGVERLGGLLREAREAYTKADPNVPPDTDRLVTRIQLGQFEGRWISRDGHPQGVVVWVPVPRVGSEVVFWYSAPGREPVAGWAALLRAALDVGPVRLIPGELPGVASAQESDLLTGAGFARYHRYELQLAPGAALSWTTDPGDPIRPVQETDKAGLAHLTEVAYAGGLDRHLFQTALDPSDDAREQIELLFSGRYGAIDARASNVWQEGGALQGALLVTRAESGGLIIEPSRRGDPPTCWGEERRHLLESPRDGPGTQPSEFPSEGNEYARRRVRPPL
ncbi:MAG: hypothetical protein ACYCW9_01855, partial [Thermoplasmata archaeon]